MKNEQSSEDVFNIKKFVLSHEHYAVKIGVCNSCGKDIVEYTMPENTAFSFAECKCTLRDSWERENFPEPNCWKQKKERSCE